MPHTIKARIVLGIGESVIERPRSLQHSAQADEHGVVHVLYALQKQGLVTFKRKKSKHSAGLNVTAIQLTPKGRKYYEELRRDKS